MDLIPRDPRKFTEQLASMVREIAIGRKVEIVSTNELLVGGKRLDLNNLYRMITCEPKRGAEIAHEYLDRLFNDSEENLFDVPTDIMFQNVMPRIQHNSIFDYLDRESVAHRPFVNNSSIIYVFNRPNSTQSLTNEWLTQRKVNIDNLEQIAQENLVDYAPDLQMELSEINSRDKVVILSQNDGYDSARLLLPDLHSRLSPILGGDFYVAISNRDKLSAFPIDSHPLTEKMLAQVSLEYDRLPYPITKDLFLVTKDGVAGTTDCECNRLRVLTRLII